MTLYPTTVEEVNITKAVLTPDKYSNFYATLCIDGDVDTFCHSSNGVPNPTLELSFDEVAVHEVTVVNRLNCCQER